MSCFNWEIEFHGPDCLSHEICKIKVITNKETYECNCIEDVIAILEQDGRPILEGK